MFDTMEVERAGADKTLITIWLLDGVPTRVVWRGQRWRIVDNPTRIGNADAIWHPAITHPPTAWAGWRFTATNGTETRVLDVRPDGNGWRLLASYE